MAKKQFEVALVLSANDKASRVIAAASARSRASIAALSGMGDKAFAVGRTSGAIGLGIAAGLGYTVKAAEESEIATRRLENTFKTMGETSNKAATQAANYASKLQMSIGVEDEEIMMVQSKIATFKKVSDETARMSGIFDRATAAAFDLSAGGFGEASQNAVLLGKALQDPAKGATALARTGALNKSDVPLIKQIQATYGLGAAQQFVLKKVEAQVKGQAANTATMASKTKVKFAEISETLGKALLPQVNKTFMAVGRVADRFNGWAQRNPVLLGGIVKVVGALAVMSLGISAASFVFGGLFKAIALGRTLFAAIRTAQIAFTMAQLAGTGVTGGLTAAMTALNLAFLLSPITWIVLGVVALIAVGYLLIKNWDKVKAWFVGLWDKVTARFSGVIDFIKKWGLLFLGPVGWIIKYWSQITAFFGKLWQGVKNVFTSWFNFYIGLYKTFFNFGINIVTGLWEGIKSKAVAVFNFVKSMAKNIAGAFKSALGIASPSKVFMDYGVNITEGARKGIEKGSPAAVGASRSMAGGISPKSGARGSGGGMTVTFAPVINGSGNAQDIAAELKKMMPAFIREIQSVMDRKQRLSYG